VNMPNTIEFAAGFNGRIVTVVVECDGYKPLDIEVYEDGRPLKLSQKDHDQLYQLACEKAAERMWGDH
jgi:hypothetical protein